MAEFFYMGGYALYVWTSFGITSLILGWQYIQPIMHERKILEQLARKNRHKSRSIT